jgi:hypothetical protein
LVDLSSTLGYLGGWVEEVEKPVKFIATSLVAVILTLASTQVAAASTPAKAGLVVKATIWPNLIVTFSPKTFKHGKVVLKVKNRSPQAHQFSINGLTTKVGPHAIVAVPVTFKRRATYAATLTDCGYPVNGACTGQNPDITPGGIVKVT